MDTIFLISKDPEQKKSSKIFKAFGLKFGAQGTEERVNYHFFYSINEARVYLTERGIKIVGIEIGENARSLFSETPFEGDTCFVLGNEGDGIMEPLKAICDYFIYIPQYTNKTASLNVSIAGSIILLHFARWAGYSQQEM